MFCIFILTNLLGRGASSSRRSRSGWGCVGLTHALCRSSGHKRAAGGRSCTMDSSPKASTRACWVLGVRTLPSLLQLPVLKDTVPWRLDPQVRSFDVCCIPRNRSPPGGRTWCPVGDWIFDFRLVGVMHWFCCNLVIWIYMGERVCALKLLSAFSIWSSVG